MMTTTRTRSFPPQQESVHAARVFVEGALHGWGLASPESLLVVSELATNAVLHARTRFTVVLRCSGRSVRVEVQDSDPRVPEQARRSRLAPDGRGLNIVDGVSREWGVQPSRHGKTVWGEVACRVRSGGPTPKGRPWLPGRTPGSS